MFRISIAVALRVLCFAPLQSLAQGDMEGAADHPKVPRIEGTYVVGYAYSDYDEGVFIDRLEDAGTDHVQVVETTAEGKRTRIVYVAPSEYSNLGIRRNYEKAFGELGEVTEHFSCRNETCPRNLGDVFIWPAPRRIPTRLDAPAFYSSTHYYQNQSYWHATVSGRDAHYRVSVYSAERPSRKWNGQHFVHLEIVESDSFQSTLTFVDAAEMDQRLASEGRIALYGIQFEFDSSKLVSDSNATLAEIAKALTGDPDLKLYVVGHTDSDGSLEYNLDLSGRRAEVVVNRLVAVHGIDSARLHPMGVGPAAPVASNETKEGRALNRRVELVRQ